jgi:hypothetical protein
LVGERKAGVQVIYQTNQMNWENTSLETLCLIVQTLELFTNPILWMGIIEDKFLVVQARFEKKVKILSCQQVVSFYFARLSIFVKIK